MAQSGLDYGSLYGPVGGKLQNRFAITNDPRKAIVIPATAGLNTTEPAHKNSQESPLFLPGVSTAALGCQNLWSDGRCAYSYLATGVNTVGSFSLAIGNTNEITTYGQQVYCRPATYNRGNSGRVDYMFNGQLCFGLTGLTDYGSVYEPFATPGTVTASSGSPTIVGVGTTFATGALTFGGYVPSLKLMRPGDLIGVGAAGARNWYRIVSIANDLSINVFPNAIANQAGVTYTLRRTGWGSHSRVLSLDNGAGVVWYYYCGNASGIGSGTIEAASPSGAITGHQMCPQNGGGIDIVADDIIYYKGFLLYGSGGAISWSISGFPTAFPFGATDFPATNTTVVDNTDTFVAFEPLGDQVIAIFRNSLWLINPTGVLPEFTFYRIPEAVGCTSVGSFDPEINTGTWFTLGRPTTSSRSAVYYVGTSGLMECTGSSARPVSNKVANKISGARTVLSYDQASMSVHVGNVVTSNNVIQTLMYQTREERWFNTLWDGTAQTYPAFMEGDVLASKGLGSIRVPQFSYLSSSFSPHTISYGGAALESLLGVSTYVWTFATPILNLSDDYDDWIFGGFSVDGNFGASGLTFIWLIYAGRSPWSMALEMSGGSSTSTIGTPSSRDILGKKIDKPFIQIVVQSNQNGGPGVQLTQLLLYDARETARK